MLPPSPSPARRAFGRRLGVAAVAALGLLALPVVAGAQDVAEDPSTIDLRVGGLDVDVSEATIREGDRVQIVLDADDALSDAEVRAIADRAGVEELRLNSDFSDDANLYIGWVRADRVEGALDVLSQADGVEAAEVNARVAAFNFPNDPLYQFQWHFEQIHMPAAWKTASGKGVVVAVLDTGVAYADRDERFKQATDLAGTGFTKGWDFVDDDAFPLDEHGHGTHVAGTIAQTTNNGIGVAGVAFSAQIMPIRVLNKYGMGSTSDIADGIRWSADNGAQVINMSLGGPLPSLVMRSAVNYAHGKGVTVVAAAGNAGRRMRSYPAAYNNVIAVAATQYDKTTTFYSQWGKFVDVAAPGGNTRVDQNRDGRPDGVLQQTINAEDPTQHDYALYMGTSMASPHVAGVAALLYGQGVTNPDEVERILKSTADDSMRSKTEDFEEHYGAGIIDASAAVKGATSCFGFTRLSVAGLLGLLLISFVRRRDLMGMTSVKRLGPLALGLVLASSGLFFLPMLLGDQGVIGAAATALGHPIAELDLALLGPSFHQNALLASALIPGALLLLGLGNDTMRSLAIGLAIGFAGFLFVEAVFPSSDIVGVPGMGGMLDRAWLVVNGLVSTGLAALALKRY